MPRKRAIYKKIYLTEEENLMIKEKMNNVGLTNFNAFARLLLKNGYVIKVDSTEIFNLISDLTYELHKIGNNINQIAKVANTTSNIYQNELDKIIKDFENLKKFIYSYKQILDEADENLIKKIEK